MASIDIVAVVLVLAALLGAINDRYVRLPAPIGMLLGSLVLALLLAGADVALSLHLLGPIRDALSAADLPHVFLDWVLALLLFAGSLHVDLPALRRHVGIITVLATAGVVISTTVFCVGLWLLLVAIGIRVPIAWCFVLGAILAPTDAVVVETLLGGAALGCACGALAGWTMRRVADDAVRMIVSLALVVGCYRLADACEVSGPVAVVSAGLLLGYLLRSGFAASAGPDGVPAAAAQGPIVAFWSLLDRVLNLGLFLLIGVEVLALIVNSRELAVAAACVPLSLAARAISVGVPSAISGRSLRVVTRQTTVLTWAGMRGGVSIALALTMPVTIFRGQLLVICYTVVLFSIIVQGLTLPALLSRLYRGDPAEPQAASDFTSAAELPG